MDRKLRVGMIGSGAIAKIAYLPILSSMENIEFVGIMSRHRENAQKAQRHYGIKFVADDIEQLVKMDLDCAFVLSPKEYHYEQVMYLLKSGLHVYCEKPMALTLRHAESMANMAEKAGRQLMIGFNRRFAPVYIKAKEIYEGSHPNVIIAKKNRPESEYRATFENAIHMVDLMRYFMGECREVHAISRFTDPYYENCTTAYLRFESGAAGILVADRNSGQWVETLEMHGGNYSVYVDSPDSVTVVDPDESHTTTMTPLAMGWAKVEDKLGFRNAVEHFLECIKTGKLPLTNASDAYNTHELLHRILKDSGLPDLR